MMKDKDINIGQVFISGSKIEQKFILVSHFGEGGDKVFSVVSSPRSYHFEILSDFKKCGFQNISIHGGGKLRREKNHLVSFGKSTDYGVADIPKVNHILEEYCKEQRLEYTCKLKSQNIYY